MALEIVLLEWERGGGLQLLGRSTEAELVETVRERLIQRIDRAPGEGEPVPLQLVGLDRDQEDSDAS